MTSRGWIIRHILHLSSYLVVDMDMDHNYNCCWLAALSLYPYGSISLDTWALAASDSMLLSSPPAPPAATFTFCTHITHHTTYPHYITYTYTTNTHYITYTIYHTSYTIYHTANHTKQRKAQWAVVVNIYMNHNNKWNKCTSIKHTQHTCIPYTCVGNQWPMVWNEMSEVSVQHQGDNNL
jgi:hypothetical protein